MRDIVVLSHGFKESIGRFTSNWRPVRYFRLEKVIVRCVESMLSSLYSLCLALSGWGDGFTFSKNNYQKTKRAFNKEGQGLCSSIVTVEEKQKGETDIAHLSQTDENRTILARCGVLQ